MTRYLVGIALCCLIACQSGKPDPQMKEAFDLHELAIRMHDSLTNELNTLNAQTLAPEDQQKWEGIKKASSEWKTNLVEVPGFEHDHEHEEGHSHDHHHDHAGEALKDLPPPEMLKLQQAMVDEVHRLLKETRQLAASNSPPSP